MIEFLTFLGFLIFAAVLLYAPQWAQAKREREMMERMKALRDADEVGAMLESQTHEVRGEAEGMRQRGSRRF